MSTRAGKCGLFFYTFFSFLFASVECQPCLFGCVRMSLMNAPPRRTIDRDRARNHFAPRLSNGGSHCNQSRPRDPASHRVKLVLATRWLLYFRFISHRTVVCYLAVRARITARQYCVRYGYLQKGPITGVKINYASLPRAVLTESCQSWELTVLRTRSAKIGRDRGRMSNIPLCR